MRSHLMALFAISACVSTDPQTPVSASGNTQMPIVVTLDIPSEISIAELNRGSNTMYVKFTNTGNETIKFPGQAISRNVLRTYSVGSKQQSFDWSEPPSFKPEFIELKPGANWSHGFGLDYPDKLLTERNKDYMLKVCADWDTRYLDKSVYPDGSYDWAESFNVCKPVHVKANK